ncbi:HlyD family efflux transporter periplasmic adaptor subunit [Ralstonia pickettii]|nr:HlyD family efflux transporter periplasmic adaptor subunit [Ralstonia pickettii]
MRRNRWIILGAILFICLNVLLIVLDKEGKVDRVTYINAWTNSYTADMKETLEKPVVLAATEEEPVFFDKSQGVFQEFLVNEGDNVAVGDGLFIYQVHNYYETEANLLTQIDKVNGEITAIEQAITKMRQYTVPESNFDASGSVLVTEEDIFVELPESSIDAELMKEQFLLDKEKELAQKQSEVEAWEKQLDELRTTGDTLTFQSPYNGKIQHISNELADPIILIAGQELRAVGDLSEKERADVEMGMSAELILNEIDATLPGTIETLADTPKEPENVEKESIYPFTVNIEEEEGSGSETELLSGYHGLLSITMAEVTGVTAVEEAALIDQAVWRMDQNGLLLKQPVETGMQENKQIEIQSGINPNELIALEPENRLRDGSAFITPIKWKELKRGIANWKEIGWKKPFISGLLSR